MKSEKYIKSQSKVYPTKLLVPMYVIYTVLERFNAPQWGFGVYLTLASIGFIGAIAMSLRQDTEVDVIKEIDTIKDTLKIK